MIRNLPRRLERLETREGIREHKSEPHTLVFIDPVRGETCRYEMKTRIWLW